MKKTKSLSIVMILTLVAAVALAGCSKKESNGTSETKAATESQAASETTSAAPQEKVKLTVETPDLPDLIGKKDRVTQFVADKLNIDLTIIAPPWNEQYNKLRLLMASGDAPDVFATDGTGSPDLEKWISDGLVLDITDLAQNYPNIMKVLNEPTNQAWKTKDGKWYGIPKYYDSVYPHGLELRQDWLDELNLQMPKTTDELYEVLKKFKESDPDGKKNIGLSIDSPNIMKELSLAFTGINGWGKVDGTYQYGYTSPGYKDFLKYMHKLFDEGLLDPDYVLSKGTTSSEKFVSGRAGAIFNLIDASTFNKNYDAVVQNFPDAAVGIMPPLTGPAGSFQPADGIDAITMVNISSKSKNPEKALELIDYLLSDEGQTLTRYGIEGVHHTKNGDQFVMNQAEVDADKKEIGDSTWNTGEHALHTIASYDFTRFLADATPRKEQLVKAYELTHAVPLRNPVVGFTSETYTNALPKIKDLQNEYQIKFISGKLDIDKEYDNYVAAIRKAGLDVIEKEVNEFMQGK